MVIDDEIFSHGNRVRQSESEITKIIKPSRVSGLRIFPGINYLTSAYGY